MKRVSILMFIIIFAISIMFGVISCKEEAAAAETTAAAAETTAAAAETTAAAVSAEIELVFPKVVVSTAYAPYIDCSYGTIGTELGWFEELGIEIKDPNQIISITNHPGLLGSGTVNIAFSGIMQTLPSLPNVPGIRCFQYLDLFQGTCIMGQPEYKSVDEYMEEGLSLNDAIKEAVAQMKGKTLLLDSDPGSQFFATSLLEAGGLKLDDVVVTVADAMSHVPQMLAKKSEFEHGGAPTIISMLENGFKQIIRADHVAQSVVVGGDITPLRAIIFDGPVALVEWMEPNMETVYRYSSVLFRIAEYINTNPVESASIQAPWLNRYGGSDLSVDDVQTIYKNIDPFFGYYDQHEWYNDKSSPYYWEYFTQTIIDSFVEAGTFKEGEYTVEEINWSHKIYNELENYRLETDSLIAEHEDEINEAGGSAKEFLDAAKYQYSIFNFYDANRFMKEAVRLIGE